MIGKILGLNENVGVFRYNIKKQKNQATPIKPFSANFDSVSFKSRMTFEEKQALFDNYEPVKRDFGGYKIPVHNDEISTRMKNSYSSKEFENLFKNAQDKGTFDIEVNPKTGYVKTSQIDDGENALMSKLIWVTDSCNFMPYLKDNRPELCVRLTENLSKFYSKQQKSFDKVINNPLLFELNHDWSNTAKNGVGHVFNPDNMLSHKWFARTRLDSVGLYLQTATDLILTGFKGEKYGYKNSKEVSNDTINAIANTTAYLQKIIYPYAKDTGAWEEKTFNSTASSDVAIINQAYRNIIDLMYSPTEDKELLKVRKRLCNAKNGDVFKDKYALIDMLKIGEYRIKTNSEEEFPKERVLDGAMSFIFKTEKLDDDALKNASAVMKRLERLEKKSKVSEEIVRENGILRYINDNYLHINQNLADKDFKQKYSSKFPKKTEAQWFMVSDLSKSYGLVAKSLIDYVKNSPVENPKAQKLLDKAMAKETEYINRGYARLTGENTYKANGEKCPSFKVPEAYQSVTDSKGRVKFVPGTHTPLTWAQVSLYDASKLMLENLKEYESLKPSEQN